MYAMRHMHKFGTTREQLAEACEVLVAQQLDLDLIVGHESGSLLAFHGVRLGLSG